ncbi:MAG: tyrosine-type recombinase/integrase [Rhodospirillales bacterium]
MLITSEGPARITRATIEAAWKRRGKEQRLIVRDQECRGLALIVNATTMAWSFSYRPRGIDPVTKKRFPNRTISIGNHETHSPDDARAAANRFKGQAIAGADPVAERKAKADADRLERALTLSRLAVEYAAAFPTRPKQRGAGLPAPAYVREELAQLRLALLDLDFGGKPVARITEADTRRLLQGKTGATARARFGAFNRFMDWCQDMGHIKVNPCTLVARARRPKAVAPRSHYLTPSDAARLWHAAEGLAEPVWQDFARFLICMPCRRGEAASLEWSHVDLDAAEWRQPGRLTKNRDPHRLYLHPLALGILCARRETDASEGLVFRAPRSGKSLDTFTAIKKHLTTATGIKGWTWHDCRRSFATALGEAGIAESVADAILNHRQSATRSGVLGTYQRATRWPEQVRAMEHWSRLLDAAINGADPDQAKVIELKERRA